MVRAMNGAIKIKIACFALAALVLTACRQESAHSPAATERKFTVNGVVKELDADGENDRHSAQGDFQLHGRDDDAIRGA